MSRKKGKDGRPPSGGRRGADAPARARAAAGGGSEIATALAADAESAAQAADLYAGGGAAATDADERRRPPPAAPAPAAAGAKPAPPPAPEGALAPRSEAEAAEMVRDAAAAGRRLEIVGGGTRGGLGRPVAADVALSTAGLGGVALYEPSALTLVAGAGARLADVVALLAAEGQRLPFEPMDHRPLLGTSGEPTLGGVVACNVSGPRRIQAGACRDALIGVRFVDGRGTPLKNGGRVMKNVTGYDLVKLMCGAFGTLGLLTQVAFKLQPVPETEATLTFSGLSDAAGVAALAAALGSPFDVTGAAHRPAGPEGEAATMVRIEGFETSVGYRARALRHALAAHGDAAIETNPERSAALWRAVRDAEAAAARPGAVWRLSMRPTDAPKAAAALAATGSAAPALYDWGGGLMWLVAPEAGDAGAAAIRAETARFGGHATLVRAGAATRATVAPFEPEAAAVAALSEGLRRRFDPAGVLNPGRMAA